MTGILLEAIAFNHDPASAGNDAFNIRRNASIPIVAPEWRRGVGFSGQDAVAAYAIRETSGAPITIKARFSRRDPQLTEVEVRAVQSRSFNQWPWQLPQTCPPGLPAPCRSSVDPYFLGRWQQICAGNILGEVKARMVNFQPNGDSGMQLFELQNVQLADYGVGIHPVKWWWQYRHPGGAWVTFAASQHKIYTVLALPTEPWQQSGYPGNPQLPWAEVLDVACAWARGAADADRAAERLTLAVFSLGPQIVEYNCPNLGGPMYVSPDPYQVPYFDCTAFLERLKGGIGRGRYVNCSDCASIVSTFANSLGCDLWQARMGQFPQGFALNPIWTIGSRQWSLPCGFWPGFGMHEVAWKGECTEDDALFDACLALDRDSDPLRAPHYPLVPANLRFGRPGDSTYRDRLASPNGRQECRPMPATRQRRIVV